MFEKISKFLKKEYIEFWLANEYSIDKLMYSLVQYYATYVSPGAIPTIYLVCLFFIAILISITNVFSLIVWAIEKCFCLFLSPWLSFLIKIIISLPFVFISFLANQSISLFLKKTTPQFLSEKRYKNLLVILLARMREDLT